MVQNVRRLTNGLVDGDRCAKGRLNAPEKWQHQDFTHGSLHLSVQLGAIVLETGPLLCGLRLRYGPKLTVLLDPWSSRKALELPALDDIDRNLNGREEFMDLGSYLFLGIIVQDGWLRRIAHDAKRAHFFAVLVPMLRFECLHHLLLLWSGLLGMVPN